MPSEESQDEVTRTGLPVIPILLGLLAIVAIVFMEVFAHV